MRSWVCFLSEIRFFHKLCYFSIQMFLNQISSHNSMITPLGSRIRSPFLLICSMVQSSMAKLAFFSFNNRFQASMSVTSKAMCCKPWRFSGTEPFFAGTSQIKQLQKGVFGHFEIYQSAGTHVSSGNFGKAKQLLIKLDGFFDIQGIYGNMMYTIQFHLESLLCHGFELYPFSSLSRSEMWCNAGESVIRSFPDLPGKMGSALRGKQIMIFPRHKGGDRQE